MLFIEVPQKRLKQHYAPTRTEEASMRRLIEGVLSILKQAGFNRPMVRESSYSPPLDKVRQRSNPNYKISVRTHRLGRRK